VEKASFHQNESANLNPPGYTFWFADVHAEQAARGCLPAGSSAKTLQAIDRVTQIGEFPPPPPIGGETGAWRMVRPPFMASEPWL